MTNADKIRRMSDTELAQFLEFVRKNPSEKQVWTVSGYQGKNSFGEWIEWLQKKNGGR